MKIKPASISLFAGILLFSLFSKDAVAQKRNKKDKSNTMEMTDAPASAPQDADSIFAKALQQKAAGDYDNALISFKQFAKLKPNNATAHYEIAKILYLEKYDVSEALQEAEIAARLEPDNKWIKEFYADMLAISQKKNEANAIYKDLSDKEALPQDYLMKQIMLYVEDEKYDEALGVINKLNSTNGYPQESILMMKYDIFIHQKKYDSAVNVSNQLIDIDKLEPRYQIMLANAYENSHDSAKAETLLNQVAGKFPNDAEAQASLLQYYLSKKNIEKAGEVFGKALRNSNIGNDEKNFLVSIFTVSSMADSNAAVYLKSELAQSAAIQPVDTHLVKMYAEFLFITNEQDSAAIQYKKLVELDNTDRESWNALLLIYAQHNEADSLIKYGSKAMVFDEGDINFNYLTGIGYQLKNDYAHSLPLIEKAVQLREINKDYFISKSQMYASLADAYYFVKQYKQSDSMYDKALESEPNNATALNNYSYYLSERGERLAEAEKMSARSLEIRPDEATFLDTYGWIMYKQGNYKKAKKFVERAIGLTEEKDADGSLFEHLGDIELKLGNSKDAIQLWKKAQSMKGASNTIAEKINSIQ